MQMDALKKIYNSACKVAFSVNIGIALYGLIHQQYTLLPLCLVNCLLLSFAFIAIDKK
jgi:hypothetical protein